MGVVMIYNTFKEVLILIVLLKALKFFRSFGEYKDEFSGFARPKSKAKLNVADKLGYACKFCNSKNTEVVDAVMKDDKNFVEVECGNCGKFSVTSLN